MAKILIVDDSRIFRNILHTTLTEKGHEVVGMAQNGQVALDYLEANSNNLPDIVTLDITMPVLDGLEALKQIHAKYPSIHIIMASAAGQKSKVIEALKNGASDFIQKPFQTDEICAVIEKQLS